MRNDFLKISLFFISAAIVFLSCSKAGPGGGGTIKGSCIHHTRIIPFDTVYIKYNAKELPGVTPGDYDNHVYADKNGYFEFDGYKAGNYYLYAFGYDTTIARSVTAGIPVKLKSNSDVETVVIPVTEGD